MEVSVLIRISQIGNASKGHLLVEGTLSDGWVDALEASCLEAKSQLNGKPLYIDLSGVTYIDDKGRELLARIIDSGSVVRAAGIMAKTIVDEITTEIKGKPTK